MEIPSRIFREHGLINAFFRILESNVVPSQPGNTYVNFKSNVQAANTFWVGYSFRPLYFGASEEETFTRICVPSIAPTQS